MKKAAVLLLFILVLGGLGLNVNAASSADRATWLWNPWMIVNDEEGTLAFLESKQVNKVYVQIDREIPMKIYQSFITLASAKGIEIYALDGAPDWVAPKGTTNQNKLFNWLKNYQNGSTSEQKFAGIHLDVEPYLYNGWTTNQAATIKSYQALLSKAKTDASGMNLPLEADMPFWFDEIIYRNTYGKGMLAEWVIANTDSVTIMAYRDGASMIMDIVENEINLAGQYGKSLVIGVETGQTDEGEGITFFEEGEAFMNGELKAVSNHYAGSPGFKGIAVHHAGSWMELNP
ncbi:amidase [Niallia endozanthoxylica]|uniref:Amidase n=1 Tax=Niallia endozanthoxylica TaxID=2036016 RepID=A0A5J5I7C0_9BACI|nr:amidase [Niallia endozanthoxylica]KAA9032383.1 amidase [Niallia endozanthoxylica]